MSLLIQYLVKLSISLAIVWLFYQFILRRLTFYNSNRWYLAGYTLLSFLIPFINIAPVLERNKVAGNGIVQMIPSVHQYTIALDEASHCPAPIWSTGYDKWDWMAFALVTGMAIFLVRFIIRCVAFFRMRLKARLISEGAVRLYEVDDHIIPFSFGNSVFINSGLHTEEDLQEIIRHEFVHVKQMHTLDIIWSEWLCILNWYNPFAWLLKASIRQNLEFIADNNVLKNGVNKKQYQYLLLKVVGNNQFSIASKFNFSSLKKRIAMMNKLKSARVHGVRFLFILPLLAVILISFRKQIGDSLKQDRPDKQVMEAPVYFTDSVPAVTVPNNKGYIINIRDNNGQCTIVVKGRNGKEVDRLLLTKWNENEKYYRDKYGDIPPPPADLLPTAEQWIASVHPDVKTVTAINGRVTVTLKNGRTEKYDLSIPDQKTSFERKYGKLPEPPTPPAAPDAPGYSEDRLPGIPPAAPTPPPAPEITGLPDNVRSMDMNNGKVTIVSKDGTVEKYDLSVPEQKASFKKKYGGIVFPQVPTVPPAPSPDKRVSLLKTDGVDNIAVLCDEYEITNKKAVMHLRNGATEEYDLTDINSRRRFEKKYGRIINTNTGDDVIAPVAAVSHGDSYDVIAPIASTGNGVLAIDPNGYLVTGEEDALVTITNKTTKEQLEGFKKQMKEKGIELKFDNVDYNNGILVSISGTMKSADASSTFSVTDFKKLVLAMVRDDDRIYFKVNVSDNKVVI